MGFDHPLCGLHSLRPLGCWTAEAPYLPSQAPGALPHSIMMGKLPLGVASPYVKMSSGGCTDPMKFYATSYCTAYGEVPLFRRHPQDTGRMGEASCWKRSSPLAYHRLRMTPAYSTDWPPEPPQDCAHTQTIGLPHPVVPARESIL